MTPMPPSDRPFSWRDPRFTYADALTGSRLVMLPYCLFGLATRQTGLTVITLAAMIGTDLIDGRIARWLKQSRPFGAVLDSTIDFVVIYSTFTALWLIGTLRWWQWAVIFFPALLMAATQILHLRRAPEVSFAAARVGKLVGQIQFVYLPWLVARALGWRAGWATAADQVLFTLLAIAIAANTVDHAGTLRRLLRNPSRASLDTSR